MGIYTISNQKIETEVHKIIQYLAAAGNSFLSRKNDDSHTNLKSLTGCGCLATRPLNRNGDVLAFSYTAFALEWWVKDGEKIRFALNGKTHKQTLDWIRTMASEHTIEKQYNYEMHYQLPYDAITKNYTFNLENEQRLTEIMHYRILSHFALEDALMHLNPHSEIRVWPHHFDIAALFMLNKQKGHIIGLGMSIPDNISSDFYLYVKGYAGENTINTTNISALNNGAWDATFKGAVLPLNSKSSVNEGYEFFKQAAYLLRTEGRA